MNIKNKFKEKWKKLMPMLSMLWRKNSEKIGGTIYKIKCSNRGENGIWLNWHKRNIKLDQGWLLTFMIGMMLNLLWLQRRKSYKEFWKNKKKRIKKRNLVVKKEKKWNKQKEKSFWETAKLLDPLKQCKDFKKRLVISKKTGRKNLKSIILSRISIKKWSKNKLCQK